MFNVFYRFDSEIKMSKSRYATLSTSEKEYYIEKILADRVNKRTGLREFKIRWQGFSAGHDTWEPEENLQKAQVLRYNDTKLNTARKLVGMLPDTYAIEGHHGKRSTTGSKRAKETERISEFFVRSPEGQLYSALPKQVPPSDQLYEYMSRRVYASDEQIPKVGESKTHRKEILDLSIEKSKPHQIRSQWRSGDGIVHSRFFVDGESGELVHEKGPDQRSARDNILNDELELMEGDQATHRQQAYARFLRFKKRQGGIDRYTIRKEFEDYYSAVPAIIPSYTKPPVEAIVLRKKAREVIVLDD